MNLSIDVIGEVNNPGRYSIDKDHLTILDALSRAGDLTIYGKREKVLVLRNENGTQLVYDVEPNDTKARQSTVNGNNVRSTSFWISLASLLTSIAVLIVK